MRLIKLTVSFSICLFLVSIVYADEITRIVTNEEPPTNYYSKEGKFTGPSTEIVEEIKKNLNLYVEIDVLPWGRAYMYAKKGPNVAIFTAGKTQERIDHGFHFIGPIFTRNHVLVKRKGTSYLINSLEDVKKQKLLVGAMRGDWRAKLLKDHGIRVDEAASHEQNVRKLMRKRFDLWVLSDLDAPFVVKNAGFNISDIEIAYVIKEDSSYIMLSRDTSKEIVERWQNTFFEIQKTDFLKKTAKKWSDILELNLGYTVDKGFYLIQ